MSLQVWLPLNGNLENRGLLNSTLSTTGTITYSDGKTGVKSWLNSENQYIKIPYSKFSTNKMSIAFWIKPNSPAAWRDIFSFGFNERLEVSGTDGTYYWYSASTTTPFINNGTQITTNMKSGTWYHFSFTVDGTSCNFYLNGSLIKSITANYNISNAVDSSNSFFILGGRTNLTNPYKGYMNDVRIYNHCLTQKEVQELSKGLVSHWRFCTPPVNLLKSSPYSSSNKWHRTSVSKDGFAFLSNSVTPVKTSSKYYIGVYCDGNLKSSHSTPGDNPSNKYFTIFLYERLIGTTKAEGSYDNAINLNKTNLSKQIGNFYIWEYSSKNNSQDIGFRVNTYSDGTNPADVKFWNFTIMDYDPENLVYTPGENSIKFPIMGYSESIEEDCSGYNRKGEFNRLPRLFSLDNNSPMNINAYNGFLGGVAGIWGLHFPNPLNSAYTTEFTFSVWFKLNNVSHSGAIWNGRTTAGAAFSVFVINNTLRIDDSTQTTVSPGLVANTWYHLVVTWKSGDKKITYLNGVVKSNVSAANINTTTKYGSVGISSVNDILSNTNYLNGALSDMRFYCTALTQAQVTELYSLKKI